MLYMGRELDVFFQRKKTNRRYEDCMDFTFFFFSTGF